MHRVGPPLEAVTGDGASMQSRRLRRGAFDESQPRSEAHPLDERGKENMIRSSSFFRICFSSRGLPHSASALLVGCSRPLWGTRRGLLCHDPGLAEVHRSSNRMI